MREHGFILGPPIHDCAHRDSDVPKKCPLHVWFEPEAAASHPLVFDREFRPAELTIDCQVEQGKIPDFFRQLEADPYRPYLLQLQRCLLADQFALVPGSTV
jgi:hypothetical protein